MTSLCAGECQTTGSGRRARDAVPSAFEANGFATSPLPCAVCEKSRLPLHLCPGPPAGGPRARGANAWPLPENVPGAGVGVAAFSSFPARHRAAPPQRGRVAAAEAFYLAHRRPMVPRLGRGLFPGPVNTGCGLHPGPQRRVHAVTPRQRTCRAPQTVTSAAPGRVSRGRSRTPSASFISWPGEEFGFSPDPHGTPANGTAGRISSGLAARGGPGAAPARRGSPPLTARCLFAPLSWVKHMGWVQTRSTKRGAPRGDRTNARLRPAPAERRGVAAR